MNTRQTAGLFQNVQRSNEELKVDKNSEYTIPLTSQKAVRIALLAESAVLNFYGAEEP
jgi:hypothetical protein